MHRIARVVAPAALVAVAALTISGCSSSSAAPVAAAAASGGGGAVADPSVAAAASAAASSLGLGAGGPLDVSKLCAAIPAADVQKLFKATVSAVVANPGECTWNAGALTVDIYPGDTSKQYYNGGAVNNGTPVSGIGDVAQWSAPVAGATAPFLAAQKGSLTVTVSPPDVDASSITYAGSAPFFKITPAATLQYVVLEGQLCNDIFAAAGS